ncbi:putative autotransporter adhesin-like protein [Mucilaginibacter frigoritolerans]|uniref:Putative autotransporter adhesin-like protein n=1 Tax=Mucilaginibacter frigoritolerans TaxID=652788 RepID=A0A562U1Z5_9SPHI|nr:head GIN domain-containing protein [Mucilaginibacter frigoritolerans]TWI99845.1 putative autotransporter adhesin-like protein [Mucilaginibacter frigoritolerans]
MKKIAYSIFALLLLTGTTFKALAQSEQSRSVSGFHSISSSGPFDVHVNINGTESLKISASSDIINEIETVVEDGNLEIKFKHHSENHDNIGRIDVYVTAKSLSGLANAGSGSIKVEGVVSGDNVNIVLSGSGSISSSVKSGDLHATISGSGSIHLNGHTSESKVTISGSGELNGKELKTGSASVLITGSGNAYFSAEKTISAHIVGSGNVVYTGSATVTDSKTIGSGSVSKAD